MNTEAQLHVFFFPFMAHGHLIPTADMAKLFAAQGVRSTIITTPLNAAYFSKTIELSRRRGLEIGIQIVKFPSVEVGLPEECENIDFVISQVISQEEMLNMFIDAIGRLREPVKKVLQEFQPSCLVSDVFFPWTVDVASELGIPRISFYGTGCISICASELLRLHNPHKKVSCDSEPFIIPELPGDIQFTRQQLPDFLKQESKTAFARLMQEAVDCEHKNYGIIFNSFYELERPYIDYYWNIMRRKAWNIGPLSLCNRDIEEKAARGKKASIDLDHCIKWLDLRRPTSVVYVCFGTVSNFTDAQLIEIAEGLEASQQQFIWVVRRSNNADEKTEKWLPEGFEERVRTRGLIIRGWSPQLLILDHVAVGAFVTHCGWNSVLEGITAGVPLVTWPVLAEQFFNEKLVTQVLKVGIEVGVKRWGHMTGDLISKDDVAKAVERVMLGQEAENMRRMVKKLSGMAKTAVEEGGSSSSDLDALIQELRMH